MREKLVSMIMSFLVQSETNDMGVLADQILALFISNPVWTDIDRNYPSLEGIEVVEKCPVCHNEGWNRVTQDENADYIMPECICHGTGEITRQAEWGDIDVVGILKEVSYYEYEDDALLATKSGGRLRVKEKP